MNERVKVALENMRKANVFIRTRSDKDVLKLYISTGINGLKEERNDYEELLDLFKNGSYRELLNKLNNDSLVDFVSVYETL